MAETNQYKELTEFLRGQGQNDFEISLILDRVRQYETETQQDSIMDAIGNGSLDLAALIKDVLGEQK